MHISRALLAMGLTLSAWAPASAQTQQPPYRPERPYRGIFASGMDDSAQSLVANATFSGGYDDNVLANASNSGSRQHSQEGAFGQFSGGLGYSLNAGRGSLNAGAGTSQRYYPTLADPYFSTYNASVGGTLVVTTRPTITLNQSAGYQPHTFLSAFPMAIDPAVGAADIADPDVVPLAEHYVYYAGGIDLGHRISRRTTFSSYWDYRTTNREVNHYWRQTGGATVSVNMNRDVSLRLGYTYTRADYDDGRVVEVHRPEIGLDFARGLSLTRRTSANFSIGTEASVYDDTTRVNLRGNAALIHEIGRTWTTTVAYQRGTYFVDTFAEPVTGDSASAQLVGLITRRIQFSAVLAGTISQLGYNQSQGFDSYRGTVSLSTALTRYMNVGVDYAYYQYAFDDAVALEPGLSQDVTRQSIRGHVSLWAPIFNKARRTNASR